MNKSDDRICRIKRRRFLKSARAKIGTELGGQPERRRAVSEIDGPLRMPTCLFFVVNCTGGRVLSEREGSQRAKVRYLDYRVAQHCATAEPFRNSLVL